MCRLYKPMRAIYEVKCICNIDRLNQGFIFARANRYHICNEQIGIHRGHVVIVEMNIWIEYINKGTSSKYIHCQMTIYSSRETRDYLPSLTIGSLCSFTFAFSFHL